MQDISGASMRKTAPVVDGFGSAPQQAVPAAGTSAAPSLWEAFKATGKKGILTTVLVLIVAGYAIGGLMAYSAGPGSGAPKAVPMLYSWLPSASVVLQGNKGAFATWRAALILAFIGLVVFMTMVLVRRFRNRVVLIVVGITTVLLTGWAWPQTDKWYIGYNDYVARYNALSRYSAKQTQPTQQNNQQSATTEEDLRAQALQQVVVFRYSEQLAAKQGVKVTNADVEKSYQGYVKRVGGEATLKKQLKEYLGWTVDEYKHELRSQLLQERLNAKLAGVYKGEADAAKQDLKTTKVKSYVYGLEWSPKLRNIQVK